MHDEMSGQQLAEVLRFLAGRVQHGLDEGRDIIEQLRVVAEKLEEQTK